MRAEVKFVIVAVASKGAAMGALLIAVLNSDLSDFAKGLIIAVVSALITGFFTVLASILTTRRLAPVQRTMDDVHESVHDVQRKVGATKRVTDPKEEEC